MLSTLGAILAEFRRTCCSSATAVQIKSYLDCNYAEQITLSDLADEFQISRFQVFRLFRQRYDLTLFAYVTRLRLQRASEMLLDGASIAQVAWDVGFVDQSHVTRHFKRYFGVTPLRFCSMKRAS